ncbi:Protein HVA22 [Zostera marina]|uniref:HVA22-like protein n=1 Tax=Zostera marina TaxID=29655 RepID=A0A0K9PJ11_ZOSMR|nr:Protein HVA22 [Zostera marina]
MGQQFWDVLAHLNTLAGPTIMLIYPLYASVCALESKTKVDDEQWLAYWIIYSLLTLTEMVAEPILYWIPIWYQLKVAFVAWLVLPQFHGAAFIYEKYVRAQLKRYQNAQKESAEGAMSPNKKN